MNLVQVLIEDSANAGVQGIGKLTPLHMSSQGGHLVVSSVAAT